MSAALLKRVNADIESRQSELNSLKTAVPTSVSADRFILLSSFLSLLLSNFLLFFFSLFASFFFFSIFSFFFLRIVDFVLATDEPFINPEASLQWKTSNDKSPCCVIS